MWEKGDIFHIQIYPEKMFRDFLSDINMGKDLILMSLIQWNYSGSQIFQRGAAKIILPL